MLVTEFGIVNVPERPLQPENAELGIVSTFPPILNDVIFVLPDIPLLFPNCAQLVAL